MSSKPNDLKEGEGERNKKQITQALVKLFTTDPIKLFQFLKVTPKVNNNIMKEFTSKATETARKSKKLKQDNEWILDYVSNVQVLMSRREKFEDCVSLIHGFRLKHLRLFIVVAIAPILFFYWYHAQYV